MDGAAIPGCVWGGGSHAGDRRDLRDPHGVPGSARVGRRGTEFGSCAAESHSGRAGGRLTHQSRKAEGRDFRAVHNLGGRDFRRRPLPGGSFRPEQVQPVGGDERLVPPVSQLGSGAICSSRLWD